MKPSKSSNPDSKPKPVSKRTTRGIKLGNLNENALAKKSAITATEQKKIKKDDDSNLDQSEFVRTGKPLSKSKKDLDKELRRQYDKGKAYDEDEDDRADRNNMREA